MKLWKSRYLKKRNVIFLASIKHVCTSSGVSGVRYAKVVAGAVVTVVVVVFVVTVVVVVVVVVGQRKMECGGKTAAR